ncbi:MAG: desulfoferrodoxin family protein [Syntrophomonadaceae bacterium]|nr:desulfoferrodoxin family protein [Syntrophomonadaceae bacterium]
MAEKFFLCKICGNVIGPVKGPSLKLECCGEPMTELVANTVDAAQEKHVPVATVSGNTVKVEVGSVPHPMLKEHHIAWVWLKSEQGVQRKKLPVDGAPQAVFALTEDDKAVEVYEYCNLHGLWKAAV